MDDLDLGGGVRVPASEIEWRFSPSGGPGGQHANKANTRAEATLDLVNSPSLPPSVRRRLVERFGHEASVAVDDERSQRRNREIAIERLREQLAAALVTKKRRRATKPSRSARRRRVEEKKRRGETKRLRRRPDF